MKRKDVTEAYYTFSGTVSTIVRGLGLSGVALVWLFRITDTEGSHLPGVFWPALIFFLLTLFLDLAQYVIATAVWGYWDQQFHDQGKGPNANVSVPDKFRRPQAVCFWLKIATVVVGYVCFFIAAYNPVNGGN